MKTTKKVVLAALAASCVVAGAMGLSACGGEGGHVHTYSTTWTAGETQHYYAVACEHTDASLDKKAHEWNDVQITEEGGVKYALKASLLQRNLPLSPTRRLQ